MSIKVAIQGYEGCFHHQVARRTLGERIEIVPCDTFRELTRLVDSSQVEYGVMAVENSIAGSILPNLGLLHNSNVQVVGEYYLKIAQNLMALRGTTLEEIREVHSHPMALLQCVDYLDEHPWRLIESEDTALSAKRIAEGKLQGVAAIAGVLAAELYDLEVIAPEIQTIANNFTRFLILRPAGDPIVEGANKASLCFKTNHQHGSLMRVLQELEPTTINMTKLQSSPIPSEPWRYMFHIDMEFDTLAHYYQVVESMRRVSDELHVYGVYPRGENGYSDTAI